MAEDILMFPKCLKLFIPIILIFNQITNSSGLNNPGGINYCPPLTPSLSTNFECKFETKPVGNCRNPIDKTTVLISCNPSYEEPSLEINPIRLCQNGRWSSTIPQCYPSNRGVSSAAYDPSLRDQTPYHRSCQSLTSTTSTNIKCELYGRPLVNCENPMEGTTALFSCNPFHKGLSLGNNPNHITCRDGKWSSSIPQCYPIYDNPVSSTTSEISHPLSRDQSKHPSSCPPLTSSLSTNIKCVYNGHLLNNCENAGNGTLLIISCNPSYEEPSLKNNPIRTCQNGKWSSSIPQCHSICGRVPSQIIKKSNLSFGSKIFLTEHDHPWHVGIYNSYGKIYICGGSIIHPKIILTAAQCVTDDEGNHKPIENLLVVAGNYYRNYNDVRNEYSQYSKISQIYTPIGYRGHILYQAFDIAILILDNPFAVSVAVQPVCLALNEESENFKFLLNNTGIVTGWGSIKRDGPLSDELKQLIIPYVPFRKCYQEIPEIFRQYITNDKICGGYINNGTNICTGDGGGGFIFKNVVEDRYYIKGILSIGLLNDLGECYLNQYSAYTSILYNIEFLKAVLKSTL